MDTHAVITTGPLPKDLGALGVLGGLGAVAKRWAGSPEFGGGSGSGGSGSSS